jgi:hypothetical protein
MPAHASPCWVGSQSAKVPRLGDVLRPRRQRGKSIAPNAPLHAGKRWADPNFSTVQRGLMALWHHGLFESKCAQRPVFAQYSPHPVCLPPISADQHRFWLGVFCVCVCVCVLHCCTAAAKPAITLTPERTNKRGGWSTDTLHSGK